MQDGGDGSCGEVGEESLGRELPVYFPTPKLSGDNGAMVGAAAYYETMSGVEPVDPYAMNIYPRISIERWGEVGEIYIYPTTVQKIDNALTCPRRECRY